MKKVITLILIGMCFSAYSQIDRDQFALDVSKADEANMGKLTAFLWKKASVVTVDGEVKANILNEISITNDGKIEVTNLDASTTVKQQRGIRGRIQSSTAENNSEYMEGAINHAMAYIYMSKGQLIDFFDKAKITDQDGIVEATATDVLVKGDKLTVKIESATKLFIHKEFTSTMGEDPISGQISFGKFKSGISHVTTSNMNLPAKKAVISSNNKDYVQKVQ